jgi:hypothetical protein
MNTDRLAFAKSFAADYTYCSRRPAEGVAGGDQSQLQESREQKTS